MAVGNLKQLRTYIRETLQSIRQPDIIDVDTIDVLAAADVMTDVEFYNGMPSDQLIDALNYLYTAYKSPPPGTSSQQIRRVIMHVRGLLGLRSR